MSSVKTDCKVWLITGTSSGFGKRLVLSVLARGDRVIATARSLDRVQKLFSDLESSQHENLRTIELDVTDGESAIKTKIDHAATFWGRIDVLVNNAGVGMPSVVEEGGSTLFRRQFETNFFGLLDVTTAALPYLRAQVDSVLVVIGSRCAWRTEMPLLGPYTSSKAAVHALSETLMVELAQFSIKTLLVEPGSFRTEGIYSQPYSGLKNIAEYDDLRSKQFALMRTIPGKEKGDPNKAMEAVVDVVKGQGVAKGRPWPNFLVLGNDAEADVRAKCLRVLATLDEWVDVTRGVNFDAEP